MRFLQAFRSNSAAAVELRAHAPVLPVLSRQLEEAAREMETEVANVCLSFQGMASRARSTVRNAAELLGEGGGSDSQIADVIRDCRETMLDLLQRMQTGGELSVKAIEKMEQLEQSVGQVAKVLEEVNQSAFANRIVALNAKIEAVHLGEAGKGFEVVADEISTQAERSSALTLEIGASLKSLVEGTREAVMELRGLSAADREWIQSSREDIHRTLAGLEQANDQMRSSLQASSEQSAQLARDIQSALVTLQFQDRVNQRIQHVAESLRSMHEALSRLGTDTECAKTESRRREIAESLAGSYTMNSERSAHAGFGQDSAGGEDDADVELF